MGHGEVVILHNDADIFRNCMRQETGKIYYRPLITHTCRT